MENAVVGFLSKQSTWNVIVNHASKELRNAGITSSRTDGESASQSALLAFHKNVIAGHHAELKHNDENEMIKLLMVYTKNKVIDRIRREYAQKRNLTKSVSLDDTLDFASVEIDPALMTEFKIDYEELWESVLTLIKESSDTEEEETQILSVLSLRVEGFSSAEICEELGLGPSQLRRIQSVIDAAYRTTEKRYR